VRCEGSGGKGRDAYGAGEVGYRWSVQLLRDCTRVVGGDGENGAREELVQDGRDAGRQGSGPESLLDLKSHTADRKAPHDQALIVLQLDRCVLAPLLGGLEEVSVDELEVLPVLLLEVAVAVDIRNETWVSDVVKGNVDPSTAIVVGLDDVHVVIIDEGVLLVKRGCRVERFGVDGVIGCVGVGSAQDDGVRGIGE